MLKDQQRCSCSQFEVASSTQQFPFFCSFRTNCLGAHGCFGQFVVAGNPAQRAFIFPCRVFLASKTVLMPILLGGTTPPGSWFPVALLGSFKKRAKDRCGFNGRHRHSDRRVGSRLRCEILPALGVKQPAVSPADSIFRTCMEKSKNPLRGGRTEQRSLVRFLREYCRGIRAVGVAGVEFDQ